MADSTLAAIRTKVRRLTRSLSESQLTTAQLDEYVNTFVLYDFPEHLRLFNLKTTFAFYTDPYIDTYATSTNAASPLFNFKNKYITVHQPIYIAGRQVQFFEDRTQFFGQYPNTSSIESIGVTGDGVTTAFSGTLTVGGAIILRNNVLFSSLDTNSASLAMIDLPISPTIGNLYVPGGAPTSTVVQDVNNFVNYTTGAFTVTFGGAPGNGEAINSQIVLTQPTLPDSLLFYNGEFTLRPVPDQAYKVEMDVYVQPTELLASNQDPDLNEWWQYIAYGAARKVFQDRMDLESAALIEPEYKKQENLVLRRTIVQQTSQRVSTIYTQQTDGNGNGYGPGFGNQNF